MQQADFFVSVIDLQAECIQFLLKFGFTLAMLQAAESTIQQTDEQLRITDRNGCQSLFRVRFADTCFQCCEMKD